MSIGISFGSIGPVSDPDFYYVLGYGYELSIFKTEAEARAFMKEEQLEGYYSLFKGWYGAEISASPAHLGEAKNEI